MDLSPKMKLTCQLKLAPINKLNDSKFLKKIKQIILFFSNDCLRRAMDPHRAVGYHLLKAPPQSSDRTFLNLVKT